MKLYHSVLFWFHDTSFGAVNVWWIFYSPLCRTTQQPRNVYRRYDY